jgi:hypothetical protein
MQGVGRLGLLFLHRLDGLGKTFVSETRVICIFEQL